MDSARLLYRLNLTHHLGVFHSAPSIADTLSRMEKTIFRAPAHRENHLPCLDVCLRDRSHHLFDALSTPLVLQPSRNP